MNTGNRVLWTLIGLALTAAGALGLAAGNGWLRADPASSLWPAAWTRWWQEHENAAITFLAVGALLAVAAGLTLLRRQLRTRARPAIGLLGPSDITDSQGRKAHQLKVRARGLSRAVAADLATHREVRQASVALTGDPGSPTVDAHLHVTSRATVGKLAEHMAAGLRRLESTLGAKAQPRVLLTIDADGRSRVS